LARQLTGLARVSVAIAMIAGAWLAGDVGPSWAHHMDDWVHDHSTAVIPARPDGLAEIHAHIARWANRRKKGEKGDAHL